MLKQQQKRMFFRLSRVFRRDVKRRSPLPTFIFGVVALVGFLFSTESGAVQAQESTTANELQAVSNRLAASVSPNRRSVYADAEPAPVAVPTTPVAASSDRNAAFERFAPPKKNERCYSKTFATPQAKNPALVGAFYMRLLPEPLRAKSTWRYDERAKKLTIYGPIETMQIVDEITRQFDEQLFDAFADSGEYDRLIGLAGVVENPNEAETRAVPTAYLQPRDETSSRPRSTVYDPERNIFARVAYQADGAIIPPPQDEAPVFGAPVDAATSAATAPNPNAPNPNATPANAAEAALDDATLEIATYRCLPSEIDRVEELARRSFASNPEIAFSVDRRLGTLVVHTNRKMQRAVRAYFAAQQIYPNNAAPNAPDLRVATGAVRPIDGIDSNEPDAARAARQTLGGSYAGAVAPSYAAATLAGETADVYRPKVRDANELKNALTQLFGDRFQKLGAAVDASAPFSERQVETYRFVKRPSKNETVERVCDVEFDPLRNVLALRGDAAVCAQMLVLLDAMDRPPLQNGNVRRFIPIRNADSVKIRQIFEYGNRPTNASPLSFDDRDPFEIGAELAKTPFDQILRPRVESVPFENLVASTFVFDRFAPFFVDVARSSEPIVFSATNVALASARRSANDASKIRSAAYAAPTSNAAPSKRPIMQVVCQDGGGGLSALDDLGTDAFGDFDSQFGDFDSQRRGGAGVGVVQDFVPTVLQDLDVVIVDNATDAEFERIRQMIAQIEELAKIADPTIEVYNLKYVDGAMLHGVLTKLYQEMFATKQGRVMFYALQNPNALLVVGWGQAFSDMKSLIEVFDKPIADGGGAMRVVRLRYASANEIATTLAETFVRPQTDGTGGLAPRVRAFADVRSNSLVIQAAPNDWQEIQKLLVELDVNTATAKLTTRVFSLKNSLADDIRTTIMSAILPAKQGTLDTDAAKFPALELLAVDETGRRLIQSGVMMDVDVVADVYHNCLIVNAPEDSMEFMEKLIEILDVAPKKAQIRFFQVRHGDASQIMKTLQSLLATSDQNISTPTIPQAEGEETFVPIRFALDTRTNVIIAAAAPKELAIVDALVVALDVKDVQEREEVVVQLRNIQALVVAEAIDDYLAQKQMLETTSEVLSTYQLYESQVIVIPESISNSIIVSAAPEYMDKILEMIKTFDADPPQVVIQLLITEVTLTDQEEFGVEAGLQDATSFDRSLITNTSSGSATGTPGFDVVGGNGPGKNMNSTANPTNIAGQVLNSFGMGAANSSLGYGGFVLSASSRSVDVTLRALREKNRLQVLSRPQVTAMDNQQAFVLVGQRVPRIDGTTTTNYGVQMNTSDTPVGLILLVTPRVTKDGRVVMEIGAEKSGLGADADAVPIYSQGGEVIKSQSIDTIQAMTAISARDGETVMIGGLLTSTKKKIGRGVPYLSDIPVVGWLFRYDQEVEQRKELLIVMTPRIMRSSEDFAEIKRVEASRMNWVLGDAMELNGSMGLFDAATGQGYAPKKTQKLSDRVLHPDPMNELKNVPAYSPERDYAPRPETTLESSDSPYGVRASRNSTTTGGTRNSTTTGGTRSSTTIDGTRNSTTTGGTRSRYTVGAAGSPLAPSLETSPQSSDEENSDAPLLIDPNAFDSDSLDDSGASTTRASSSVRSVSAEARAARQTASRSAKTDRSTGTAAPDAAARTSETPATSPLDNSESLPTLREVRAQKLDWSARDESTFR